MKKKKRSILPAAILIGVLLTAALLFFLFFPRISFTEKHPTLERMNEYPAESFIAKANGTVSFEEDFLPTEEVGEKKFIYSVKKGPFTRKIGFSFRDSFTHARTHTQIPCFTQELAHTAQKTIQMFLPLCMGPSSL